MLFSYGWLTGVCDTSPGTLVPTGTSDAGDVFCLIGLSRVTYLNLGSGLLLVEYCLFCPLLVSVIILAFFWYLPYW
jgi:hypothetical protein